MARIAYHSNTTTTLGYDREVADKVALPSTTTQLDGNLYALADAMQFLSMSAPNLTNLDWVVITTHEPRALNLIIDMGGRATLDTSQAISPTVPAVPQDLQQPPLRHRHPPSQRPPSPPHSLPYTHSLDSITTTHELERLQKWQLLYNNSHVSRLVRATIPTVSLKLHPFWQLLCLAWKHQDNPDRELGMAWEEEQCHLSKLAGDRVTTA
ncbi:hypothetical protein H0H81_001235 [Sphagnurus paluster]|uniref:Uncharacterized protein n=1 Tax=Sphagnurus paluster TaxID=117069 RepID=A0A9P7K1S1_9AGAR|nr:hypothetical protein H0H81_001235 [Sphagnurus paluster]